MSCLTCQGDPCACPPIEVLPAVRGLGGPSRWEGCDPPSGSRSLPGAVPRQEPRPWRGCVEEEPAALPVERAQ